MIKFTLCWRNTGREIDRSEVVLTTRVAVSSAAALDLLLVLSTSSCGGGEFSVCAGSGIQIVQ